jgi:hypothetical protein
LKHNELHALAQAEADASQRLPIDMCRLAD